MFKSSSRNGKQNKTFLEAIKLSNPTALLKCVDQEKVRDKGSKTLLSWLLRIPFQHSAILQMVRNIECPLNSLTMSPLLDGLCKWSRTSNTWHNFILRATVVGLQLADWMEKQYHNLKKCQSREATMGVSKGSQSCDTVDLPGTDRGNVPCNVAYFTTEQTDQILAGLWLLYSMRYAVCIRNT